MGTKKDIFFLLIFWCCISWSSYFSRSIIITALIISLISLQNVVNTFKKQSIFCCENISSVYLIFYIILLNKKFFWKKYSVHFKHFVSDICPTKFTSHRTSWQTGIKLFILRPVPKISIAEKFFTKVLFLNCDLWSLPNLHSRKIENLNNLRLKEKNLSLVQLKIHF